MKKTAVLIGMIAAGLAIGVPAQTSGAKAGGSAVTPAQRSEIEKAVTAAMNEWTSAINVLDSERCMKLYSAEFQERLGGGNFAPTTPGREAMAKWVSDLQNGRSSQKFQWSTIKVYALSPDIAYSVVVGGGTFAFKKTGRSGGIMDALTMIWRKEVEGWRIMHMHESWW